MARSTLLLPLFLAALASAQEPARLDVVEMRSGERLTGHVVSQAGGMVEIRLGDGAVVGIGALLIPPVIDQTRQLAQALPTLVPAWEQGLERVLYRIPGMTDVFVAGEHRIFTVALEEAEKLLAGIVPRLF